MSGLEVLGAVAASLQVVGVIRKSVHFLNDVRKPETHKSEQAELHISLFVQAERFQSWCDALGIPELLKLKSEEPQNSDQKVTELQNKFELELKLANRDLAQLVLNSVVRLEGKLKEASGILQSHELPSSPGGIADSAPANPKPKKRWYKFSGDRAKSGNATSGSEFLLSSNTSHLGNLALASKSAQWVSLHRSTLGILLDEITRTNDNLHALLDRSKKDKADRNVQSTILSCIDLKNFSTLPGNGDIEILIKMKALQDSSGEDMSNDDFSNHRGQVRVYHIEEFEGEPVQVDLTHSICKLDTHKILVEWKFYSQQKPMRMQRMAQLSNLVNLLQDRSLYAKFLSPICKGLVSDDANSRIGIIFTIASHLGPDVRIDPKYSNLQTLIRTTSESSSAIPSLGARFAMAKKLALVMHNLHSVHWLHKSFRSDNMIFFEDTQGKDVPLHHQQNRKLDVLSEREIRKPTTVADQLPPFYPIGWNMSRPDSPYEYTESVSHPTGNFKSGKEHMKLYAHPDAHGSSHPRARYRAEYDLYSLGLVLLEIGLWRTLDMIRKKCRSDEDFREKIKTEWCDKLNSRTGALYWRATQRCLTGDFGDSSSDVPRDDFPLQKAFHEQVVCELEKCYA